MYICKYVLMHFYPHQQTNNIYPYNNLIFIPVYMNTKTKTKTKTYPILARLDPTGSNVRASSRPGPTPPEKNGALT